MHRGKSDEGGNRNLVRAPSYILSRHFLRRRQTDQKKASGLGRGRGNPIGEIVYLGMVALTAADRKRRGEKGPPSHRAQIGIQTEGKGGEWKHV